MPKIFVSHHEVYYSNRLYVPIPQIADSLLAMERIVRQCRPVFAMVGEGCGAFEVRLDLESLQSGSLRDTFLVKFIFGSEEAYDRWVRRLRELTGVQDLTHRIPVVGPIIVGAVMLGASYAVTRMAVRDASIPGTSVSIQNVRDSVILVGADALHIPAEQFRAAMERQTGNAFNLASNACKVIRPAKTADGNAEITIDGNDRLKIVSEAVRETPVRVERSPEEPLMRTYTNESVVIRALDLDSPKKGWAVVVHSISEKRLKMEIAADVDRTRLLHSGPLLVDIQVFFHQTEDGQEIPVSAFLQELR